MKFIIKNNIHEIGETGDRSGFLFFPKEIFCEDEGTPEIRWLRFAKWRQIYVSGNDFDNAIWFDFRWSLIKIMFLRG